MVIHIFVSEFLFLLFSILDANMNLTYTQLCFWFVTQTVAKWQRREHIPKHETRTIDPKAFLLCKGVCYEELKKWTEQPTDLFSYIIPTDLLGHSYVFVVAMKLFVHAKLREGGTLNEDTLNR